MLYIFKHIRGIADEKSVLQDEKRKTYKHVSIDHSVIKKISTLHDIT